MIVKLQGHLVLVENPSPSSKKRSWQGGGEGHRPANSSSKSGVGPKANGFWRTKWPWATAKPEHEAHSTWRTVAFTR